MQGETTRAFRSVRDRLQAQSDADPDYSAQLCIYQHGHQVADLAVGEHLELDSLIGLYSSSKGIAALIVGQLADRGLLDFDKPVASYWPEFAAAGKSQLTVGTALSHRAGLIGVAGGFTLQELLDQQPLAARLAAQRPYWQPGTAHGYHAFTVGTIVAELVQRVTGERFQDFYERELRAPLNADCYFGVPDSARHRLMDVLPAAADPLAAVELTELQAVAFGSNGSDAVPPPADLPNRSDVRRAGHPAMGGIGNARGLARLYACAITEVGGHQRLLSARTIERMSAEQAAGPDLVLGKPTRYGVLFQLPSGTKPFGASLAFGHDGRGGGLGYADPATELSMGYLTSRLPVPGGVDHRALELSALAQACATGKRS